ncbi:hypothetical protein, partial [Flavobacterium sp.]|uniref:hypothetical protein n=1 Tax=Flavobacterium sp. TaxID=239 RepID=UPI00391D9E2C
KQEFKSLLKDVQTLGENCEDLKKNIPIESENKYRKIIINDITEKILIKGWFVKLQLLSTIIFHEDPISEYDKLDFLNNENPTRLIIVNDDRVFISNEFIYLCKQFYTKIEKSESFELTLGVEDYTFERFYNSIENLL